jgi:hypothetical protein
VVAQVGDERIAYIEQLITNARNAGQLRSDFEVSDFTTLIWAMSQVIRETAGVAPQAWQRCLAYFVDGLRPGAAHALPVPPLTGPQLATIMGAR